MQPFDEFILILSIIYLFLKSHRQSKARTSESFFIYFSSSHFPEINVFMLKMFSRNEFIFLPLFYQFNDNIRDPQCFAAVNLHRFTFESAQNENRSERDKNQRERDTKNNECQVSIE